MLRTICYLHVVPRAAKSMPGTAKEKDGLATLDSKTASLLDCDCKITKLTRFQDRLLTKVSKVTDPPVEIVFRVHLQFSWLPSSMIFHIYTWTFALISSISTGCPKKRY